MSRRRRNERAEAFHHVTCRASSDVTPFPDGASRWCFLELLGQQADQRGWEIVAYCVLSTHYHVVLWTPDQSLGDGFHWINFVFAKRFNRTLGRRGPVWSDRFFSKPIETDAHLARAIVYVDRNAVEAALVSDARDWPWSSFRSNAGMVDPFPWHRVSRAHAALACTGDGAAVEYQRIVERVALIAL